MISTCQKRTKLAKQQHSTVRLELQFLAHHKQQYNEQYDGFASNSHTLKSRTALENFKLLIELDIKVLVPSYWVLMFSGQSLARTLNHPQSSGFGFALLSTQKTVSSSFL